MANGITNLGVTRPDGTIVPRDDEFSTSTFDATTAPVEFIWNEDAVVRPTWLSLAEAQRAAFSRNAPARLLVDLAEVNDAQVKVGGILYNIGDLDRTEV